MPYAHLLCKMMRITALGFVLISLWACKPGSTGTNKDADSANKSSSTDTVSIHTAQPDVVAADEHSLTDRVTLQNLYLLGNEVTSTYAEIPKQLKQQIPGIMKAISENKVVITGSYHIVLKESPESAKPIRIFIGIPVQKPVKAAGLSTFTLPAGKYLRHQCAAEPGQSLLVHQRITTASIKNPDKNVGLPIIEKYAETRNDEMTSVASKATFFYTLTQ